MDLNQKNYNLDNNNNLEFTKLLNLLKREQKLVTTITTISTIISVIFYIFTKPTWNGSFQIVVSKPKNFNQSQLVGSELMANQPLSAFRINEYKTQEIILKSPSVLMPVFDYVKNYSKQNKMRFGNKSYKEWINEDLDIYFEKGSRVLTINYKNKDKKLILNTLKFISNKYQNYAKKNKEKTMGRTISYLEKQKEKLSLKSYKSLEEFNNFAINNGLTSINGFVQPGNIENYIDGFNSKNYNSSKNSIGYLNQFRLLESYETDYRDSLSKLKPNSTYAKKLKIKIDNLRSSLKRPSEILLKFRNLEKIANRDEQILSTVSLNLESAKLSKARQPDPWELISDPIIDQKKVFPRLRHLILMVGATSIVGNFIALFYKLKFNKNKNETIKK